MTPLEKARSIVLDPSPNSAVDIAVALLGETQRVAALKAQLAESERLRKEDALAHVVAVPVTRDHWAKADVAVLQETVARMRAKLDFQI